MKPATSFFVPATLFVSAVCAFVGSLMWDGDIEPTWGESAGYVYIFHRILFNDLCRLRLFSIIPLVLITARRVLDHPAKSIQPPQR